MKELTEESVKPIRLRICRMKSGEPFVLIDCHFYMPIEDDGLDLYTCENGVLRRTAMYSGVSSVEEVTE